MLGTIRSLLGGGGRDRVLYECRNCGAAVDGPDGFCHDCGAVDVAQYTL